MRVASVVTAPHSVHRATGFGFFSIQSAPFVLGAVNGALAGGFRSIAGKATRGRLARTVSTHIAGTLDRPNSGLAKFDPKMSSSYPSDVLRSNVSLATGYRLRRLWRQHRRRGRRQCRPRVA